MYALSVFFYNQEVKKESIELYEEEISKSNKKNIIVTLLFILGIICLSFNYFSAEKTLFFSFVFILSFVGGYFNNKYELKKLDKFKESILISSQLKKREYNKTPCVVEVSKYITLESSREFNYVYKGKCLYTKNFKKLNNQEENFEKIKESFLMEAEIILEVYYSVLTDLKNKALEDLIKKIKKCNTIDQLIECY